MKLPAPYKFHLSKQPWGWQWKHQTKSGDPIYERPFYDLAASSTILLLEGYHGLKWWLEDRYGVRFAKKALDSLLEDNLS
jgi:hypothetical protein